MKIGEIDVFAKAGVKEASAYTAVIKRLLCHRRGCCGTDGYDDKYSFQFIHFENLFQTFSS